MGNTLLISIIVPIYNVEKYLNACLESLVQQSYDNIEIICVDDCSKDNTIELIKKYQEKDFCSKDHRVGWNEYRVTNRAFEKLQEQYTISQELFLD